MDIALPIAGILLILAGFANLAFGYRIFRLLLTLGWMVSGFGIGLSFSYSFITDTPIGQPGVVDIAIGVVGAVIFGVLSYALWSLAIALIGGLFGLMAGYVIAHGLNADDTFLAIIAIGGLFIGAIAAMIIRHPMVIAATAFIGASLVIAGVELLIPDLGLLDRSTVDDSMSLITFIAWVVLGVVGLLWQFSQRSEWNLPD